MTKIQELVKKEQKVRDKQKAFAVTVRRLEYLQEDIAQLFENIQNCIDLAKDEDFDYLDEDLFAKWFSLTFKEIAFLEDIAKKAWNYLAFHQNIGILENYGEYLEDLEEESGS